MFKSSDAMALSAQVRQNVSPIVGILYRSFEKSILGVGQEVQFFRNLIQEMRANFSSYAVGRLKFECRVAEIHRKPIVNAPTFRCELGDLLVVVKYHLPAGVIERQSILYQVKLCSGNSTICTIDQDQLTLLSSWPQFSFGRIAGGGPRTYNIAPNTIEFGSYLIELRSPSAGAFLPNRREYGVAPNSLAVKAHGPTRVNSATFPYSRSDVHHFFAHIAFDAGEHHDINPIAAGLVDALYRHVGLTPDPPHEFDGFFVEKREEEIGFGIIEISVSAEGSQTQTSNARIP